jgi:3-dehydroshikimate dehydratase
MARITRNSIYGNGLAIERCWSGGSCDPKLRRGGIIFGVPAGEHASYVGKRGGGVTVDPGKLARICPDSAPNCQGAPNGGIAAPVLDGAHVSGMRLALEGHLDATPRSRFTIEMFANSPQAGVEGETFLGDVVTTTDARGHGKFSFVAESVPGGTPATYTATATSSDGATSEFSTPIALSR